MGDFIMLNNIIKDIQHYCSSLQTDDELIDALNHIRRYLHEISPFRDEPVDCVIWIKAEKITANDYNPNVMAPAEKRLLCHSLSVNGFTQPVVVSELKDEYMVVDGFHRQLLGKKQSKINKRLKGYLPVTCINKEKQGKAECMAATIRHNRARGQHQVMSMSDIVRDLSRLGWTDFRIGTELGMDEDEVLRLKQISGLTELFSDEEFSNAWTVR
ncbi:IbrB-like domain-containing protein [Escherichia coli]|uniref:IbrB-like domain-containing protein n=1 Tax=Escherichia coli TaxID=562 RepID=UPI000BE7A7AD|nr:ParB/RepB/Spo0J family partition protein [Escherichia coli]EFN8605137.1 transcriptional regulator [Escherichia coli O153:H12]EFO0899809.1 transcriptional regulator [Escherichia coli]EFO1530571.1 transcriptional regulator [Escherichia coli]EFR2522783.1 ParB-like nuclease domain-containing protein [Escherichia coli]EHD0866913.1 ParB-like nuclease domain-containing protein [Escherichia coli]